MKTLALSGWGQPHDALREAVPQAVHADYAYGGSMQSALELIERHKDAEVVVGWSMGGQMAVRAVAEGLLSPQRLVLIATPFQRVGAGADTLAQFRANFERDTARALKKSYALIAHGDTQGEYIKPHLDAALSRLPPHDWLYWLEALTHAADAQRLAHFPETHLIHGARDVVVGSEQSRLYQRALPNATLHVFEGAGHAPHWHDVLRVRRIVEEGR